METKMSYEDFEKDWYKRHKGSRVRQPVVSSWGLFGGILLWAFIALGAALVSGAHSVPAILRTIPHEVESPFREYLSLFGFTIFELLIFAGALYRHDSRFAGWGLIISIFGALAANIGSSIATVPANDLLNAIVAVILAVIAPSAAFLAGEMVHRLFMKHADTLRKAVDDFDDKRKRLDQEINKAFAKYERDFMKAQQPLDISRNDFMNDGEVPDFHEISRNHFVKSGEKKPRMKIHEIAQQVYKNGDVDLPTAEMMAKYNISQGSTSKVRDILKGSNNQLLQ